jgi:hypothetical protein
MVEDMKASGETIIWMELAYTNGVMEGVMKENTKKTRNMDMVFTNGPMVESIWDTGTKENN